MSFDAGFFVSLCLCVFVFTKTPRAVLHSYDPSKTREHRFGHLHSAVVDHAIARNQPVGIAEFAAALL